MQRAETPAYQSGWSKAANPSIVFTSWTLWMRSEHMFMERGSCRPTINEKERDMAEALWRASAVELAVGIRTKRCSCVEVMTSVVARIRALHPTLNAIVVDRSALAAAAAADRALTSGVELGPLFGVPVTIKVNGDQEGEATTNGLPAFAHVLAPADAPLVWHLRRAGAIIGGCTNTPEGSMRATTIHPLHGRTRSPWHLDASPGGSSGGAGVAAAVGFGPLHHGNDSGGSLRFPAFVNGVATLKPTPGRVPAFNVAATAERDRAADLGAGDDRAHGGRRPPRHACDGAARSA
jgi:amidase